MGKRREETPRPLGRPRKSTDEQRSDVIGVRVSKRERAIIEKNADGRELSAFLRQAGLAQQPRARVPLANREIAGNLSRYGNNLNQLVRRAHPGSFPDHLGPLLPRLHDLFFQWRANPERKPKSLQEFFPE